MVFKLRKMQGVTKSQRKMARNCGVLFGTTMLLALIAYHAQFSADVVDSNGRELLSSLGSECDGDFDQMKGLSTIVYTIGILFGFMGIAIVCDDYFMPSLEVIAEKLKLSEDVAGATFLAAAGSAPELFSNTVDTFAYSNNIGIGTIVGSAMFNILVIIAASGAAAHTALKIDWRPMARDVSFYIASIVLCWIFFRDGEVGWWESLLLLLLYALYVVFMRYNARILRKLCPRPEYDDDDDDEVDEENVPDDAKKTQGQVEMVVKIDGAGSHSESGYHSRRGSVHFTEGLGLPGSARERRASQADHEEAEASVEVHRAAAADGDKSNKNKPANSADGDADEWLKDKLEARTGLKGDDGDKDDDDDDDDDGKESCWDKTFNVLSWPLDFMMRYTIPDCQEEKYAKYYFVSFFMSIVWIATYSFALVTMATKIGCIFSINPVLLGVTVLAAGTSIPDALGSVFAARNGLGGMAVANAIGSNVFDICIGLGLPWIIQTGMVESNSFIEVQTDQIEEAVLILLGTVVLVVGAMIVFKWTLSRKLSIVYLVLYLAYIVYSIVRDGTR